MTPLLSVIWFIVYIFLNVINGAITVPRFPHFHITTDWKPHHIFWIFPGSSQNSDAIWQPTPASRMSEFTTITWTYHHLAEEEKCLGTQVAVTKHHRQRINANCHHQWTVTPLAALSKHIRAVTLSRSEVHTNMVLSGSVIVIIY